MFDVFYIGIKPNLFAHEQSVTSIEQAQESSTTRYCWVINYLTDYTDFDFLWEPVPWQAEYTHVWPSPWDQFYGAYLIPKHVESIKYHIHDNTLPAGQYPENYKTLIPCNFDYSWTPHPFDPPYIYVFGNQWHIAEIMPTVEYRVPGATERKYMSYPRADLVEDTGKWTVPDTIDVSTVDYTWCPDPGSPPYIYQFGTQWQRTGGPRYTVPGATEVKYTNAFRVLRTTIDPHWQVPEGADTNSFDWTWHPDDTDPAYIYQFGTQHQRTGGPQYHVPGATEIKFVDQIKIVTKRVATAIYEIDHMDGNAGQIPNTLKVSRYFDNYLDTLKRIAKNIPDEHEFVWICSSVCDYTDFDFSWHPEQWQATMLHVFPSNGEKFGDTFFMHVPSFKYRSEKCQLLEWYDLNFTDISVPRRAMPKIAHTLDSQAEAIKQYTWNGPLAVFVSEGSQLNQDTLPTVPLWREKTKTIVPCSAGAGVTIVPKVAIPYVKTQAYDYPHILKTQRHMYEDQPLDIVFISNGEPNAEDNYLHLENRIVNLEPNQLHRSSGVKGRVAAYHAAARLSTTPWFFAVFAKLTVDLNFDWAWQPDRLQEPKHYIFHAKNPCNGLIYGHQAMIAYNRELTLNNTGIGLDFTLDSAHEVVPVLSGMAMYNETPWMAWRTAFREVLKLQASLPNVENEYRIKQWCCNTESKNAVWSSQGAQDALEYYTEVNGDFNALKKSYDWEWLSSYAFVKHNLTQHQ
jgi:hypothetical protein